MGILSKFLDSERSPYFQFENNYSSENFIKGSQITEAINNYGLCFRYYVRTYDLTYDRIFGEDNNSRYVRYFDFMAINEMPSENKFFSKFGMEQTDEISVFCTKMHFQVASNDPTTKQEYVPKLGDIIELRFTQFLYEIVSLPKVTDYTYFQSTNVIWEFVVRPYKNEHIEVDPTSDIKNTTINKNTDGGTIDPDIFDIRNIIDTKKEEILYNPKQTEHATLNPYANW